MHVLQPHRHHAPVLAGKFECRCHSLAASNLPAKTGAWCHQHSHMHTRSLCCPNQRHQLVNCASQFAAMQTLTADDRSVFDCCDVQISSFTLQTSDHEEGGITGRPSLQLVCELIFRLILPQPGCPIGLIQGSWAGAEAAVARKLGAAGAAPTPAWSTWTPPVTSLAWPYQSELFLLGRSMIWRLKKGKNKEQKIQVMVKIRIYKFCFGAAGVQQGLQERLGQHVPT